GYTYQGNKVVLASPLVITGGNEISICIPPYWLTTPLCRWSVNPSYLSSRAI
ncbi:hypothetical protein ACUN90_11765, partial [Escherichia sp. SP-MK2]